MQSLTKPSLLYGLLLFMICSFLLIVKAAYLLLFIVFLVPGIVMGILLVGHYGQRLNVLNSLAFIILSGLIYIGCFLLLDLRDSSQWLSLRLLGLSGAGAMLLKLCYDLLIFKYITIKQSFLWPLLIGLGSALPSSVCAFFFDRGDSTIQQLFCCGIFLIYPIWYYGFAAYINHCKRPIEAPEN